MPDSLRVMHEGVAYRTGCCMFGGCEQGEGPGRRRAALHCRFQLMHAVEKAATKMPGL